MPDPDELTEGKKFTSGKLDWSVLPMETLPGVIRVFEGGARKYQGSRTWFPGIMFSKIFSACLRHLSVWFFCGVNKDDESGEHPLYHVIANCMIILTYITYSQKSEYDDRPTPANRGDCNEL